MMMMHSNRKARCVMAGGVFAMMISTFAILVGAAALSGIAQPSGHADGAGKSLTCYVAWSGPHSELQSKAFERIADQKTWREIWEQHQGNKIEKALTDWPVVPTIDFEACEVIGILGGVENQCNGYFLASIDEFDDHVRIRYDKATFQIGIGFGEEFDESQYRGTPYAFFVIPKTDKTIVMEEDVRALISADPIWKQQHRFPAK